VSVGRFIVYYYRFSPTNPDKMYDIGVVISIVEPAVGIIAACAPAMKILFRFSDNSTADTTAVPTKTESQRRKSFTEQYGMGKEYHTSAFHSPGREEETYGVHALGKVGSSDRIVVLPQGIPERSRSMKNGRSEAVEHRPLHYLDESLL